MMHAGTGYGAELLLIVAVVALLLVATAVALKTRGASTAAIRQSADHLLASDRARERAVALLSRAYAAGHLTSDDLEKRTERALIARTVGDLRDLTRDIPRDPEGH